MFRVGRMMALGLALTGLFGAALVTSAEARDARGAAAAVQAQDVLNKTRAMSDLSAQARNRRGTKLQVYRRGALGPNAKRECHVRYVQDYRPSGTVIVPRMQCWWVNG